MAECTPLLSRVLIAGMGLLVLGLLACLVRAILGPRYTDRVVALNLIATLVIMLVCLLSYLLGRSYLVDIAILYALLNLLAVALLSRVSLFYHRKRKEGRP